MSYPPLFLGGLIVSGIGLLLHLIAIGTTEWATGSNANVGLFRICDGDNDNCRDVEDPESELEATQAMVLMGMLAAIAGIALCIIFIVCQCLGKSAMKILLIVAALACIAAAVLNIIGVIVFGAEVYDQISDGYDLGYSFGLCIAGAILLGISGVLLLLGSKSVD